MPRSIDLHTHSSASDGTDSPGDLVRLAAKSGLAAIALTDHDTLGGLDEAVRAAAECGITCVRGCEIASETPCGEVHFVCLWLPPAPIRLEKALHSIRNDRTTRNARILEKLAEHGYSLSMDDVLAEAGGETVARPHIARALVRKGHAASVSEVFSTMIGYNKPMFVPRALPSPAEILAMAREEGATVVFAHPMLLRAPTAWLDDFTADLAARGLDALEAWHSEQDSVQTRACVRLAKRHGLALSGGSDYHGSHKPQVSIGTGKGNIRIPWSVLEDLLVRRKAKGLPYQ